MPLNRETAKSGVGAVGMVEGVLFTVVYTPRGGLTRIISARRCNAKEGKQYGPI